MSDAPRDQNYVPVLMGVSSADGVTPLPVKINPATGRIVVDSTGTGMGDVSGPASSTDGAIARYDGTSGKVIENSSVKLDDDGNLRGVNGILLDTTPSALAHAEGSMQWNQDDKTVEVHTDVNGVKIQVGQENVVRVVNKTGSTVVNGAVVYINGAQGNRPTIALASNADLSNGEKAIGVVTSDIADNANGYVTVFGLVRDLDTSAYSAGDVLFLGSTAGTFTKTEPAASSLIIKVGYVLVSHATGGVILVHVENPMTSTVTKMQGSVTKEPTGFETPEAVACSYDGAARTITLTQSGGIVYWHQGVRYSLASPWTSAAHGSVTTSKYFLQINAGGTLDWDTTGFDFKNKGQVAIAAYKNSEWTALREVHGLMQWQSHLELHYNIGTWLYSGGALTAGTYQIQPASPANADNTPGVDAATVYDEDNVSTIGAITEGTYTTLRFASSVAAYDTAASYPFRVTGTYPNINTGGSSEAETTTGQFFNVWGIFVPMADGTTSQKYRVLWMQPQASFASAAGAAAESFSGLNIGDLATGFEEYLPRIKLTFATSASWGTVGKCRIHAVSYLTGTRASSTVAASTSPGGTNGQLQYNNGGAFGGISEGTSGHVLTSNGSGVAPSFQAPTGGGGLTRDLWYSLTGAYASASTFTTTEASNAEATRLAGLAERSLLTCTDSTGATRRIGYVKSASASTTTVTYTVVTNSDLASGDKDFRIAPNRKVEDYVHRVSIPGEMIADTSNPQGAWLLNVKRASYLLPVNSAVRTAAAGSGAACAWNVYAGASNLFSAAQDMTTSATFDEKRPTTNTLSAGDNVSLRITSSAGATNKAQDFQAELFIVPQALYTSQA